MITSIAGYLTIVVVVILCVVQVLKNKYDESRMIYIFFSILTIAMSVVLITIESKNTYFGILFVVSWLYAATFSKRLFNHNQDFNVFLRMIIVTIVVFALQALYYFVVIFIDQI